MLIDHHRSLFYRAAACARMLPLVRECAADLFRGLLQDRGCADQVTARHVALMDLAEPVQAECLLRNGYLVDCRFGGLTGLLEEFAPLGRHVLAERLRRVVLRHPRAVYPDAEFVLEGVGDVLGGLISRQGLDDESLMGVG